MRGQVIQVASRVSGMATRIAIIDNQFVNQGELLFELDTEPFQIAVAQADANLKRSRISSCATNIEYDRLQDIFNKDPGAASQKELTHREANYLESLSRIDVAKEDLRGAKLCLSYSEIRASLDGHVSNVDVLIGTQIIANTPILAAVDVNHFWVFGYFHESHIDKFKIGNLARVTLMAYPDTPLQGHIESLGWGIAPSDGNASVKPLPSMKPFFQWIRLAQRIPVRIKLGSMPEAVHLRYGLTASVMIMSDRT